MLSFFPLDVLDEIWDLIESVCEGFSTYVFYSNSVSEVALNAADKSLCFNVPVIKNKNKKK